MDQASDQSGIDPVAATKNINEFSQAFASVVLNDRSLSAAIRDEAKKKFDGDTDVLYSSVKDYPVSSERFANSSSRGVVTFSDAIRSEIGSNGSRAVSAVEEMDKLNIYYYIPDGYVDEQGPILVAYTDYSVAEQNAEVIHAFTSNGESIDLDAKTAPDVPVFVIGINERVDNLDFFKANGDSRAIIGNSQYLQLASITLKRTQEGWNLGAPEVYFMVNDVNSSGIVSNIITRECPTVDKVNTPYYLNYSLFRYYASAYDDLVTVWVLEDDSDLLWSTTISVSASFNTTIEGDGMISTTGSAGAGGSVTYTAPASQALCGKKFTTEDDIFDSFLVYAADGLGYVYNGGNCSFTFNGVN